MTKNADYRNLAAPAHVGGLAPETAGRIARLILDCIHREYPNQVSHVLQRDSDARPPHELTPAFFGAYDWHSAVHAHWSLARLVRLLPGAAWAVEARGALSRSLSAANLKAEVAYLSAPGRDGFERPYGLAWVLQLAAELLDSDTTSATAAHSGGSCGPQPVLSESLIAWPEEAAREWSRNLAPLEHLAEERLSQWLPKLTYPVRTGEHGQTAFAMGLALDYARTAANSKFETLLKSRALDFYAEDRCAPLSFEPSGHDFLSPCLAEADLLRRIMEPVEFATWLDHFLPEWSQEDAKASLIPVQTSDASDGKLAHLDGLNLSRAWMLEGIAAGLPDGDSRWPVLQALAAEHFHAGLAAVTGAHYAGGHWLGSFAVYLATRRGIML